MRTKNSIINTLVSFLTNALTILIGFITQKVFIQILGEEYLGIQGLFTNIVSMLGIVELGIGSAIIYNLYKPIVEGDTSKIQSLMSFYKKCYHAIAWIVLILGIGLSFFLKFFVGEVQIDLNITFIFLLFVIDIVCSYLLSYKRSILQADQKNYIIHFIHIGYLILLNCFQLMILFMTENYYFYLIVKILMRLLENIVITFVVNQMYPYLDDACESLDESLKADIFKKVKALFFHKIGAFFVLGTDNILISKFLGIVQVGLYSNYYLIINAIQVLFGQVIQVLTPSVGNLLVFHNPKKSYEVFRRVRFLNFWIACLSSVCLLVIMDSFITIWIGDEFVLPFLVLEVLVFDYYQKSMRTSYMVFKEAAGIYYEDRYVPLLESFLNIVTSLILLHYFSLAGVFMGTIISGFVLWGYSYPRFVYKKLFQRDYRSYCKEMLAYLLLFLLIAGGTYYFSTLLWFENVYLQFFSRILISFIVPNVVLFIVFFQSDNFQYYWKLIQKWKKKEV